MTRKIGIACVWLGLLLVAAALVLMCGNTWESRRAGEASQTVLEQLQTAPEEETDPNAPPAEEPTESLDDPAAEEMAVVEIDGYGYIGTLEIPVLNLKLPVMSQWDYERLKIAPCRQFGATFTGDLVIAAHNYASHFGNLSRLCAGDLLSFTDVEQNATLYSVAAVDILPPEAVDTVRDSGFDLVLYTCTYGGETRVAVFCREVTG